MEEDELRRRDDSSLFKGLSTIIQGVIIAALGWTAFNITQNKVDISVLQTRITRDEIIIQSLQDKLDDKYVRRDEYERVVQDIKDRLRR